MSRNDGVESEGNDPVSESTAQGAGGDADPQSTAQGAETATPTAESTTSGAAGSGGTTTQSAASGASGSSRTTTQSTASGAGGSSGTPSTSAASGAGGTAGPGPSSAATGASGSTGSATTEDPYVPETPKFGGRKLIDADRWAVWTGGKPKADWTELEDPEPVAIAPTQFRPTSVSSQAKSQAYRVAGLETKFSRTSNLQTFQKKVMKHLIAYGLDTVTYTTSPSDVNQVVSVIDNHGLFNLKGGSSTANDIKGCKFDSFGHDNDRDAKEFLLNSVDESIEDQLHQDCKDDDSFVAMWLTLIHIVSSVSFDRFDKMKESIKTRKVTDYPGENIETAASDYLADYLKLHGAQMYEHPLTLTMLNSIMEAGGGANEDFRYPLRELKTKLTKTLEKVRHLSYTERHEAVVKDEVDVPSVLTQAKLEYRRVYDDNKWPAAQKVKDSKAVDQTFGRVNKAEIKSLVNKLVQSAGNSDKSKPSGWTQVKSKRTNSRNKSERNNPGRKDAKRSENVRNGGSGPRTPPPKDGESEIKFINGKKKYWCSKCNRWTISHGTENHKTTEELKAVARPSAGMTRVNFDLHPSAFKATVNSSCSTGSGWTVVLKFLASLIVMSCATWVYVHAIALGMSWLQGYEFPDWTALMLNTVNVIKQEWLSLLLIGMSGSVGLGTVAVLYRSAKTEGQPTPVRLRCGAAACKQAVRRDKAQHRSPYWKGRGRKPANRIPPPSDRANLDYHSRYSNLGRPNRRELPNVARIRMLKLKAAHLSREITVIRQMLNNKVREHNGIMAEVKRLERPAKWRDGYRQGRPKPMGVQMCPNRFERMCLQTVKDAMTSARPKPDNYMCPAKAKPRRQRGPSRSQTTTCVQPRPSPGVSLGPQLLESIEDHEVLHLKPGESLKDHFALGYNGRV